MGHQLNIKTDEAYALASEIAELTGETLTGAVTGALRERLARLRMLRDADVEAADMIALGHHCAEHLTGPPLSSADIDTFLYDPYTGLPR
jgi:antitoxin VapB